MHRRLVLSLVFCTLLAGSHVVKGQQGAEGNASAKQKSEQPKTASAYRLDFSLIELEDGKKINTRQYALNLVPGYDTNTLKIGTRVPIEMKQGEMQYLDVGTSIFGSLREVGDVLELEARAEMSNFAEPGQPSHAMPLLRQLRINGSTVVVTGKPIAIGSVDDPNSKRQYQLEVTVTKLH